MNHKHLIAALSVLACSPAIAAQSDPVVDGAPAAGENARYCLRVEPTTGSRIELKERIAGSSTSGSSRTGRRSRSRLTWGSPRCRSPGCSTGSCATCASGSQDRNRCRWRADRAIRHAPVLRPCKTRRVTSASHGRPTGRFSFDAATGKWDWDDDVFRIHGLAPGSVTPTTELVLQAERPPTANMPVSPAAPRIRLRRDKVGTLSSSRVGMFVAITRMTIAELPRCLNTLTRNRARSGTE